MEKKVITFSEVEGFEDRFNEFNSDMKALIKKQTDLLDELSSARKEGDKLKQSFFDRLDVDLIRNGLLDSTNYSHTIDKEKKTITAFLQDEEIESVGNKISEILGNFFGRKSE